MAGAKWFKADLHMHAPGIGQYYTMPFGRDYKTAEERRRFAQDYVRYAHETAQLDMIAITNHNDTSWIAPLQSAAEDLYGEQFVVLPGLEIGASSGKGSIHVLAIFPETTAPDILERLLDDDLELKKDNRFTSTGDVEPSTKSFKDVAHSVVKRGGLVVAAHVFSTNDSLLSSESSVGLARKNHYVMDNLHGLDLASFTLPQLADKKNKWEFLVVTNQHGDPEMRRERPLALLNNSDARKLEDIGRQFSWIKGDRPCFGALRNALLNPEDRVRLQHEPPQDRKLWVLNSSWMYTLPRRPASYLKSISIMESQTGFLSGLHIELHEGVNCLIGGRGSGKSAIIELLRYLWDQKPLEPQLGNFEDVFLPPSAQAYVVVTVDSKTYRIVRSGRNSPRVERQISGEWEEVSDLKPGQLLPLQVYGQKEILYASKNRHSQRDLLDRICGDSLAQVQVELSNVREQLRQNREKMLAISRELTAFDNELAELPNIEEQIRRFREQGIEDKAVQKDLLESEKTKWTAASQRIDDLDQAIGKLIEVIDRPFNALDDTSLTNLPNAATLAALRDELYGVHLRLNTCSSEMHQAVQLGRNAMSQLHSTWQPNYNQVNDEYRQALQEGAGVSPDTIITVESRRDNLLQKLSQRQSKAAEMQKLIQVRRGLLHEAQELAHTQFETRQTRANEISDSGGKVRIRVTERGDTAELTDCWRQQLHGMRFRDSQFEALSAAYDGSHIQLLALIEACDPDVEGTLRVYADRLPKNCCAESAPESGFQQALPTFTPDQAAKLRTSITFEKRLILDEVCVPDSVTVELDISRVSGAHNWRPLGKGVGQGVSIGQGCTAILSILLQESEMPLIIDQPEDDLDNRFIYDEVVQLLRRERGKRQIIVATHNANVPVGGDAEMIVALDTKGQDDTKPQSNDNLRCDIVAQGFIDNVDVRNQVALILEGGEEALKRRYEKYGF